LAWATWDDIFWQFAIFRQLQSDFGAGSQQSRCTRGLRKRLRRKGFPVPSPAPARL